MDQRRRKKPTEVKITKAEALWSHKPISNHQNLSNEKNSVDSFLEKAKGKGLTFSQQADPNSSSSLPLTSILPTASQAQELQAGK